jgi:hypothetical protein
MQFALPQLTSIVLLVHLGLGCCWHHAHACVPGGTVCSVAVEPYPLSAGHQHDGLHPDDSRHADGETACPPDGQNGHDHECEGDRCTFVRSKSSLEQVDDSTAHAILAVHMPAAMAGDVVQLDQVSLTYSGESPGAPSLPLRAHLLFRVLLI